MGRKLKQSDHNVSIYFKLNDESKWLMLDKILTSPKYATSRTAAINRALDFGLPLVLEEEFGEPTIDVKKPSIIIPQEPSMEFSDDQLKEIIFLLHDIDMNATITKSLVCSLFNEKAKALKGKVVEPDRFDRGGLRSTPDYMESYELQQLKQIMEKSRK